MEYGLKKSKSGVKKIRQVCADRCEGVGRRQWLGRSLERVQTLPPLVCRLTFVLEFGALGSADALLLFEGQLLHGVSSVAFRFHFQESRKLWCSGQNFEVGS